MSGVKRILISLPESLLKEVDAMVAEQGGSRSGFIRDAMKLYIAQQHRMSLREKMKQGYREMAVINQEWASFALSADSMTLEAYEKSLSG